MIDTSLNRVRVTTTATASLVRSGCGSHEPAAKSFASGAQGNLTNDGRRAFFYDGECQLVRVIVTNGVGSSTRSDFVYDGKMRRRVRTECSWSGSAWVTNTIVRYIYDGNLVVQERWLDPRISASAVQQQVTYVRGRDLSGSREGAGGIGGLLARTSFTTTGGQRATSYYHGDGNGNVTCLVNSNQLVVASYTYDPFGTILRQSGPMAEANLYRFSSKEWHEGSGLVYYLNRFYDPGLQRWPNGDPIEEEGGINLYGFSKNDSIELFDCEGHKVPKVLAPIILIPAAVIVAGAAAVICYCTYRNPKSSSADTTQGVSHRSGQFTGFRVSIPCGYQLEPDAKK